LRIAFRSATRTAAEKSHLNALFEYRVSFAALELATGEPAADPPAMTLTREGGRRMFLALG